MTGEKSYRPINKTGIKEMCRSQTGTHTICAGGLGIHGGILIPAVE